MEVIPADEPAETFHLLQKSIWEIWKKYRQMNL